MPVFLDASDVGFEAAFTQLLTAKREDSPDVDTVVADIIHHVRARGDEALIEYTEKFDRMTLRPDILRLTEAELDAQVALVSPKERDALEVAAERIRRYHEKQKPKDEMWREANGAELGWRWTPVSAADLAPESYVRRSLLYRLH